jgi:DNA-binding transcriptional LysR family regulator
MADLPFTLDQLRILRAIASEGSFKKAADSLYVTQPAVSLQIQNLEKQLDVSLFDRGGRKAQLTEAGHLLLSYCDRILSQCQEACRALDDLHNLRGGSLIVGASQTTGTYLMPRMIGLFRQKYPDVAVQLQVHSTRRTGRSGPMARSIWRSSAASCPPISMSCCRWCRTPAMSWPWCCR